MTYKYTYVEQKKTGHVNGCKYSVLEKGQVVWFVHVTLAQSHVKQDHILVRSESQNVSFQTI